ncbi:MAG: N-acetyltransferase [Tannerellaceae bacterium]|nr:N-acetyltransferase [Tannerellaceae bacterium]
MIYNLIQRSFLSAPVKDGDEQDFAEQLRKSSNYIPELAFVAIVDGKLAGHIMLTHTTVKEPDGRTFQALLLAPLSVLLEYRNHGVGVKLIETACREAWKLGYKAVFLCGDPAYYHRFGFRQTSGFDIHPAGNIPEQYVLVRELEEGALQDVSGIVMCC